MFHFMTDGTSLWELQVWKTLGTLFWKGQRQAGTNEMEKFHSAGTYFRSGGSSVTADWTAKAAGRTAATSPTELVSRPSCHRA